MTAAAPDQENAVGERTSRKAITAGQLAGRLGGGLGFERISEDGRQVQERTLLLCIRPIRE
jgi:hypothetical protein